MADHIHKIGLFSPLLPYLVDGHRFLKMIESSSLRGIYPIQVAEFNEFQESLTFTSRAIADVTTLANFPRPVPKDILKSACLCVTNVAADLFGLSQSLGSTEKVHWLSIYKHGEDKVAELGDVHCVDCTAQLLRFYSAAVREKPDASRFDSIAHGDLHAGNLLLVDDGFRAIDLENCHAAPAYADLFLFSMLVQDTADYLLDSLKRHAEVVSRPFRMDLDFRHALSIMLIQYTRATGPEKESVGMALHQTLGVVSPYL